jgi:hypothetical protein
MVNKADVPGHKTKRVWVVGSHLPSEVKRSTSHSHLDRTSEPKEWVLLHLSAGQTEMVDGQERWIALGCALDCHSVRSDRRVAPFKVRSCALLKSQGPDVHLALHSHFAPALHPPQSSISPFAPVIKSDLPVVTVRARTTEVVGRLELACWYDKSFLTLSLV